MMAELRDDDSAPSIHLDDYEDVSTNVSEFAQVVFHGVQECYLPGSDLKCNFTLTAAIKPHARDWIGVFKVGWTSTRQYRAFEWAPCPADWQEGQEYYKELTFKAYYLPKDEDGEYYQLCYIDSMGKMRGASTPFQFLEQSADDFVQIIDESMDILMIHNKSDFCVEELRRVQDEKRGMEEECYALKEKVVSMETELKEAKEELEKVTKEYEIRTTNSLGMEEDLQSMMSELSQAHQKVSHLSEEAGNYEQSLQQTEGAFMEVVTRELALRNKLDELEKKYAQMLSERDNLKAKLDSAEKNNEEMCEEIDNLKQLLSHSNETHQTIRESEVRVKEQYQKIQHELHQASSDRENYQILESRLASAEESRALLTKELESLKMVQEKLSRDLVIAKTEKESLKVAKERRNKEYSDEKRKMQLAMHQSREKQSLLQEQISALKDGIQQLAQEKEMATKGTKGSLEAQHIATRDLKDKVRRAQFQCKEEVRRRGELQKKMVTMESSLREEKKELTREVEDLRLRLQMAAEEYKTVYTQCRQLEAKLDKKKMQKEGACRVVTFGSASSSPSSPSSSWKDNVKDIGSIGKKEEETFQSTITSTQTCELVQSTRASQAVSDHTTQAVQAIASLASQGSQASGQSSPARRAIEEKATQSGLPAVAVQGEAACLRPASRDDTFDLKEMRDQLCELSGALDARDKDLRRVQKDYQEERERSRHSESIWKLKYESLERKNEELYEKHNKMLNDYTNMKHSYESIKFDMESQREMRASNEIPPSPSCPTQFRNPYTEQTSPTVAAAGIETRFGNPYANRAVVEEPIPEGVLSQSVSMDSMSLDGLRYPPDMVEDATLSNASDSIPSSRLPEPLQPDVLPAAAIKMVSSMQDAGPLHHEHTDDEREDAQFVDAQEFPEENAINNDISHVATAPPISSITPPATPPTTPTFPLEPKKCPECVIEFPPTYPEEDFVKHVQRHFAKLCPVCQGLLDPQISNQDFQRHVEECLTRNN